MDVNFDQIIGFGGGIVFAIVFILYNLRSLNNLGKGLLPLIIYVLSLFLAIVLDIINAIDNSLSALSAGIFFPVFWSILFTVFIKANLRIMKPFVQKEEEYHEVLDWDSDFSKKK